jgi:hypothetical protein
MLNRDETRQFLSNYFHTAAGLYDLVLTILGKEFMPTEPTKNRLSDAEVEDLLNEIFSKYCKNKNQLTFEEFKEWNESSRLAMMVESKLLVEIFEDFLAQDMEDIEIEERNNCHVQ